MLECSRCVEKLSEYIDGTLGAWTAIRLREHLKTCADCRGEYEALLATCEALRTAPIPVARPGFWRQVELSLRTHPVPHAPRSPKILALRVWAWGMAGVLLVMVAGTLRFAHRPVSAHSSGKTVVASRFWNDSDGPISMDALVALHAQHSATHPLSDAGRLHYLGSVSEQADLEYDGKLDIR